MEVSVDNWKHNIEGIILNIKPELELTILLKKFDGITFEGRTPIDGNREKAIDEMCKVLDKLELVPYQIERHKEVSNAYIVQFPELDVIYSNDEKIHKYKMIFKFLLDNINQNREEPVSKSSVLESMDIYIKQTIQAFARGDINRYKLSEKDLLNDMEYRKHLETLFINYGDEYFKNKVLAE